MPFVFKGLEKILNAWEKAPDLVREELTRAATEATLFLEREVIDATPVGVYGGAGLRGSISSHVKQLPKGISGIVGSNSAYALPVELGTKPHFPPIKPLVDWVKAKLNVSADEAEQVAFLVARKISIKGTKGHFMFKETFDDNTDNIGAMYEQAHIRILDHLGDA